MPDSSALPAEAVEAAAAVLCATDHQEQMWTHYLDDAERDNFRKDARSVLTAALPALRAHIIAELAQEAGAEAEAARDMPFTARMFGGEPFPDLSGAGSAHHWLRARLTKETP